MKPRGSSKAGFGLFFLILLKYRCSSPTFLIKLIFVCEIFCFYMRLDSGPLHCSWRTEFVRPRPCLLGVSRSGGLSHSLQKKPKLEVGFFEFPLMMFTQMSTTDWFLFSFPGKLRCVCAVCMSFLSLDLPPAAGTRRGIFFLSWLSAD